ncbi:MAG: hypothetical protein GX660_08665 [Clostridiaceae bacterium]|nr:hypothetical protein [Clostridiaceae bacterium]
MKKGNKVLFLIILVLFLFVSSVSVLAKTRSIYVGDLIELKVTSKDISIEDLRDKFKDFDVVDIKEDDDSFIITIRSFEPGEKTVLIGDKEIKIDIKSTLEEIKRDGIFEGDLNPLSSGAYVEWKYVLIILLGVFLITGLISLWRYIKDKRKAAITPYERFICQTKNMSPEEEVYPVKLTGSFKEYIEAICSCRIRGKTSSEIMDEINGMPVLKPVLEDLERWFSECDVYKFSGIAATIKDKQELLGKLIEIAGKIEDIKRENHVSH